MSEFTEDDYIQMEALIRIINTQLHNTLDILLLGEEKYDEEIRQRLTESFRAWKGY